MINCLRQSQALLLWRNSTPSINSTRRKKISSKNIRDALMNLYSDSCKSTQYRSHSVPLVFKALWASSRFHNLQLRIARWAHCRYSKYLREYWIQLSSILQLRQRLKHSRGVLMKVKRRGDKLRTCRNYHKCIAVKIDFYKICLNSKTMNILTESNIHLSLPLPVNPT